MDSTLLGKGLDKCNEWQKNPKLSSFWTSICKTKQLPPVENEITEGVYIDRWPTMTKAHLLSSMPPEKSATNIASC